MEITNEYIIELAHRERDAMREITSPLATLGRMFNAKKQEKALEDIIRIEGRINILLEIQEHIQK